MGNAVVENVRRVMREKGLKQNYVAEKSQIGVGALSSMLCGRKIITADHVANIAKALDVSPGDLFREHGAQ